MPDRSEKVGGLMDQTAQQNTSVMSRRESERLTVSDDIVDAVLTFMGRASWIFAIAAIVFLFAMAGR